jgi:hypothetical protein
LKLALFLILFANAWHQQDRFYFPSFNKNTIEYTIKIDSGYKRYPCKLNGTLFKMLNSKTWYAFSMIHLLKPFATFFAIALFFVDFKTASI